MIDAGHFPATLGAVLTCIDAFIHTADLFAICRASLADFDANRTNAMLKRGVTELKIGRCLANLGAVHQEAYVFRLDVLSVGILAKVHLNILIHSANLLAIFLACLADFSADVTNTLVIMSATELKIGRCLTDLDAAHYETKVLCFYVLSAAL